MSKLTNEEWRRFYIEDMCYEDPDTGCWVWTGDLGDHGYPTWVSDTGAKMNVRAWLWHPYEQDQPDPKPAREGGMLVPRPVYWNTQGCQNWSTCVRRDHLYLKRWNFRHVPQ